MPFFCAKEDKEEKEGISAGPTRQTYELQICGVEYITITAFWIITVLVITLITVVTLLLLKGVTDLRPSLDLSNYALQMI